MPVCIHVCTYVFMYVFMDVCMYVCMYVCLWLPCTISFFAAAIRGSEGVCMGLFRCCGLLPFFLFHCDELVEELGLEPEQVRGHPHGGAGSTTAQTQRHHPQTAAGSIIAIAVAISIVSRVGGDGQS